MSRLVGENTTEIKHRKYPGIEVSYDLSSQELQELNSMEIYKIEGIDREKFKDFQLLDRGIQIIVQEDRDKNRQSKAVEILDGICYKKVKDHLLLMLPKQLVNQVLEQ